MNNYFQLMILLKFALKIAFEILKLGNLFYTWLSW